jgi:hypothetical protein
MEPRFLEATHHHGVQPYLHDVLRPSEAWADWPCGVRDGLAAETRRRAVVAELRKEALGEVLTALAGAGVQSLLLKGVPLAHLVYDAPHQRPSLDTDLLVQASDMTMVRGILSEQSYAPVTAMEGQRVLRQQTFLHSGAGGFTHALDVHWAVSYREPLARAFPFEQLDAAAIPVPGLGTAARTTSLHHAFLLTCTHAAGHHAGRDRLIWWRDLHALAGRMDEEAYRLALEFAVAHKLCALCKHGVERAVFWFGTGFPEAFTRGLSDRACRVPGEPSAVYLEPERNRRRELATDLRALESWGERAALLVEHLVPTRPYMLARYRPRHPWLLPLLYPWRWLTGGLKWLGVGRVRRKR